MDSPPQPGARKPHLLDLTRCCAAGCRGRCYRVKWDAAQAARAGDAWWSGNGPASGVACLRPSSPSCADGDGSTSAGRWWTAGRSARCAGGKKLDRTRRSPQGGVQTPHRDRCARGAAGGACHGRERQRHHPPRRLGRGLARRSRTPRAAAPTARRPAGRPWLRFAHIVIASPPAALLRSSAVAARATAAALACSAGSSSARSPGSTGFVASPFAMNATTASITPSSRWGAR